MWVPDYGLSSEVAICEDFVRVFVPVRVGLRVGSIGDENVQKMDKRTRENAHFQEFERN